jgi:hypothetical protein
MDDLRFFPEEFKAAIVSPGARARIGTLQAGVPVFYRDFGRNIDIMEQPNGRKYEIRFVAGAPREKNYQVVRELDETAT